ncbi:hypothetical protein ABVT39_011186 [Epinephelus coioides]
MRIDNRTYYQGRDMHTSPFGELLFDNPTILGHTGELGLPCVSNKRKLCSKENNSELVVDHGALAPAKDQDWNSLTKLSKAYMNGLVPRGSYRRFLKLNQAGRHVFMPIKQNVRHDELTRTTKLIFMALCGTDYNTVPMGLGIKRLMTGAVTNYKSFSVWCDKMRTLLWGPGTPTGCDYNDMGMKLADITGVPATTRTKYWTEMKCELMAKTMK